MPTTPTLSLLAGWPAAWCPVAASSGDCLLFKGCFLWLLPVPCPGHTVAFRGLVFPA
jgi:hypothetical protein